MGSIQHLNFSTKWLIKYCYFLLHVLLSSGVTCLIQLMYNPHSIIRWYIISWLCFYIFRYFHAQNITFIEKKKIIYFFSVIFLSVKTCISPWSFIFSQQLQYFDFSQYFMLILSSLLYHHTLKTETVPLTCFPGHVKCA